MRSASILVRFVFAVALLQWSSAFASSTAPDQSDLWWNSTESGWGMQLAHRGQTMFATVYLYDAQGKPTWVTAVLRPAGGAWTGDVYVTAGPWFGAPKFDPTTVTRRVAGSMTWQSDDAIRGTLSYTIDGVTVTKFMTRQPIESDDYAGSYLGVLRLQNSCTGVHENVVDVVVTQGGTKLTVNWTNQTTRDACSFRGDLDVDGQFGSASGTFECAPIHDDGDFVLSQMRVTPSSITATYASNDPDAHCGTTASLSATRRP
jgi:hypothetical protein